jgi:hypothetical protein
VEHESTAGETVFQEVKFKCVALNLSDSVNPEMPTKMSINKRIPVVPHFTIRFMSLHLIATATAECRAIRSASVHHPICARRTFA